MNAQRWKNTHKKMFLVKSDTDIYGSEGFWLFFLFFERGMLSFFDSLFTKKRIA